MGGAGFPLDPRDDNSDSSGNDDDSRGGGSEGGAHWGVCVDASSVYLY